MGFDDSQKAMIRQLAKLSQGDINDAATVYALQGLADIKSAIDGNDKFSDEQKAEYLNEFNEIIKEAENGSEG